VQKVALRTSARTAIRSIRGHSVSRITHRSPFAREITAKGHCREPLVFVQNRRVARLKDDANAKLVALADILPDPGGTERSRCRDRQDHKARRAQPAGASRQVRALPKITGLVQNPAVMPRLTC
jgi:hypothetical protein